MSSGEDDDPHQLHRPPQPGVPLPGADRHGGGGGPEQGRQANIVLLLLFVLSAAAADGGLEEAQVQSELAAAKTDSLTA